MIVLEHEAKTLLRSQGLPVPQGRIAHTPQETAEAVQELGKATIIKAQVPIGGRMKAGGIQFATLPTTAAEVAKALLGRDLRGFPVEHVLVEEKLEIAAEVYIAVSYDDVARGGVILAGATGGIDIEDAENICRYEFSLLQPFSDYMGRQVAAQMGLAGQRLVQVGTIITQLAAAFLQWDALLLECNPIILDQSGKWWIADVHLELDDDALYRQPQLLENLPVSRALANRRSAFEQQAIEIDRADHRGVAGRLIPFGGSLGLLIGGGGASLTVMDAILNAGLKPANYCEIGGNPSVWKIKELTKLILSQPNVEKLAVIMNVVSNTRVDLVARGVIKGILEMGREPREIISVFRIPGSWESEGQLILEHYGIPYFGRETTIDQVVQAIK